MRIDQLALSRSATDRDAERRSEPGLLERLAADPETRLLLVDEPFSALDRELAAGLRQQLLQIVTTEQIATVWVTHDLHEAELIGTSRLRLFGHPGDWTLA